MINRVVPLNHSIILRNLDLKRTDDPTHVWITPGHGALNEIGISDKSS
jgi:hypothetical protein